jgi:Tfp pilus assembly protein PilF
MDGRSRQLLFVGVLCAMTGCSLFRDKHKPTPPTSEPPIASAEDKRPVNANVFVQWADVRLQGGADESLSQAERESICNDCRLNYGLALQRDPKCMGAMLGMARMYAFLRDRERSMEWYGRAAAAYPKNAEVPFEMGQVVGRYFKDKTAAILAFHQATQLDPENRTYRKNLGLALAWADRYKEAEAWLIRVMPEAEARYNLATAMQHKGQNDQAREQLVKALKADPNFVPSKKALALMSSPQGMPLMDQIQPASYTESVQTQAPRSAAQSEMSPARSGQPPAAMIQSPEPLPLNMTRP